MDPESRPQPHDDDADSAHRELPGVVRVFFTVAWCSFMTASVATVLCFALIDPAPLANLSRTAAYSLGFLFFWVVCALCGALTAWMLHTPES
jgi:hypothetical protein